MSSPFDDPKFKELRQKWYRRLKRSGFQDAERTDLKGVDLLKRHHASDFLQEGRRNRMEHQKPYYEKVTHFLYTHEFKSPREKRIWELYSEGLLQRDIGAKLNPKCSQTTVSRILKKLIETMNHEDTGT